MSEIDVAFEMLGTADLETFLADEKLKRAVGMTVIYIGELVKNLTEEFRLSNKEVPWKAIAGLRDIAAHKYQTLRMEDIYNTATMDLPDLKEKINSILNEDNE
ncbi:MAG: DUF86 domain-containing protein [Ruminiclostridium sp.]|nr:DUF86 domain-containing protein [Ruminiclostridium sp.]